MRQTSAAVKQAQAKPKAYKLADGSGLYLFVQPNGRKFWRMNYRYLDRQRTLSFGA